MPVRLGANAYEPDVWLKVTTAAPTPPVTVAACSVPERPPVPRFKTPREPLPEANVSTPVPTVPPTRTRPVSASDSVPVPSAPTVSVPLLVHAPLPDTLATPVAPEPLATIPFEPVITPAGSTSVATSPARLPTVRFPEP